MTKDIVDQLERDKIKHELSTNFLIEAGAGSGKTTSLVERMVNLIYTGICPIDKMVAITFTRKAADELKLRFQSALELKWKEEKDRVTQLRLADAIQHIEQCFIGTVHAFCSKLLRERTIEANLDLNFKELEINEDNDLLEEAWHYYLQALQLNNDDRLKELHDLGIKEDDLFQNLKKMKEYPDIEWMTTDVDKPKLQEVYTSFTNIIKEASRLLPEEEPKKGYDSFQKALIGAVKQMRHYDMSIDKHKIMIFSVFHKKLKPTFNRWDPKNKEDVRYYSEKVTEEFEKHVKPLLQAWWEYCHPKVVSFLWQAMETYEQLKQERSLLNYQDLLLKTNALLKENAEVRRYFQQKYQCLLVDEFQDTDPIQAEIMFFLTSENHDEKEWTRCKPKNGSLFVVGDPKQAIYRFRRADIDTYNRVKQLIEEHGGEVLQLTMNFRTIHTITEELNTVFESVFPEAETTYQAAFHPLHAYHEDDGQHGSRIKQLTVPADYSRKADIVAKDAENIARYIRDRIQEGYHAKDFLVINRYNEGIAIYAQMIENHGIPVSVSGEIIIGELIEFRDMLTVLKTFIDPTDSVAFVATLRSAFFGISDDDLYQWKQAGGAFSLYSRVPTHIDEVIKEKFMFTLEKLTTYQKWIRNLSPTVAIEKIMVDIGFYALLVKHGLGKRALKGLLQIIEKMKGQESSGHTTYRAIFQTFSEMVLQSSEVPNVEEEADAVRVMNIHKAKGLEAPIVFLAHPAKKVNPESFLDKHIKREDKLSKGYFSFSVNNKAIALPQNWETWKQEELRYLTAEEIRIVYVAATRAEKALIISSSAKNDRKNPWLDLLTIENIEQIEVSEEEFRNREPSISISLQAYQKETANLLEWLEPKKQSTYELWSPTDDKGILAVSREAGGGKDWGTVIHHVLEKVVQGEDVTYFIRNQLATYNLSVDREEEIWQYIHIFRSSEIWKLVQSADQIYTEVPFQIKVSPDEELYALIPTEKNNNQAIYVTGVIDLMLKVDGEWIIVDYKTDRIKQEEDLRKLKDFYRDQVMFYRQAWEQMTGEKVRDVQLFFFSEAIMKSR